MDALLLGSAAFLVWIWLFGSIAGKLFSRTFEQRSPETVKESQPKSIRVTYPIGRLSALQRV
jgi:hypothetical protein